MVEAPFMRVAAIDCGTNSIRLLIADVEGTNFREVFRDMEIVRLGQGVDKKSRGHLEVCDLIGFQLSSGHPRLLCANPKSLAFRI